jgi:sensor histidine kinase regulating citrate/malate metabolism
MNIRKKISIPVIAFALICSAVVFTISGVLYARDLADTENEKINVASMSVRNEVETLRVRAELAAMGIGNNRDLIDAIKSGDRGRVADVAYNLHRVAQLDLCTIIDAEGYVISRVHEPGYGDYIGDRGHIYPTLVRGETVTSITPGTSVRLGMLTRAPVYDGDTMLGMVSLGYRLESQEFVDNLKRTTGCEVAVFVDGVSVVTTITDENGEYSTIHIETVDADVLETVFTGDAAKFQILGRSVMIQGTPLLYDAEGVLAASVFVGTYTEENDNKMLFYIVYSIFFSLVIAVGSVITAIMLTNFVERRITNSIDAENKAIEEKNAMAYMESILNGLDMMIYVTDPKTGEILYINESMRRHYNIEGLGIGEKCYKILQNGQEGRCKFCPCFKLDLEPDSIITWDEKSIVTGRNYRNTDRYIKWPDGKTLHMQHSVDMTDLIDAKDVAEHSSYVPCQHEPRNPYADERHYRLFRACA